MSLPTPVTEAGRTGLAALLSDPGQALLAMDFDGTLAPIIADPDQSRVAPGGLAALRAVARAFGRVAVVTGRPADWVAGTGGLGAVPGLVVLGQYGAQRWTADGLREGPPHGGLVAVRDALPALVEGRQARIEDKRLSLVVHTRGAEHPDAELATLVGPLRALAAEHGLVAHLGRAIVELRPPGFDKGGVLRGLVEEYAARAVLFAGDDVGDLPAFEEVAALRERGIPGLTVCSASAEVAHMAERADLVVGGPEAMITLLRDLATEALPSG